jgi:hypothetical protein
MHEEQNSAPTTILLITHKAPAPVEDMMSMSSIQFFQTTTQTNCKCTQTALLVRSFSLSVSLFRVYNKHYILLSSCKALLLLPATPLLLVLLPATSLVVLLFPATTLLLVLLPATTNPLLLVLQLLQSRRDSSKQSKAK